MAKSKRSKKVFPCMHRGFGMYCHRCADANKMESMGDRAEAERLRQPTVAETIANRRKAARMVIPEDSE